MKLTFNLYCEGSGIVAIENIMQKACGLVATGKVKSGSVSKGDTVGIQTGTKAPIYDQVKRIETYHEEIATAVSGQLIGLCLGNISKEELLRYLDQS